MNEVFSQILETNPSSLAGEMIDGIVNIEARGEICLTTSSSSTRNGMVIERYEVAKNDDEYYPETKRLLNKLSARVVDRNHLLRDYTDDPRVDSLWLICVSGGLSMFLVPRRGDKICPLMILCNVKEVFQTDLWQYLRQFEFDNLVQTYSPRPGDWGLV